MAEEQEDLVPKKTPPLVMAKAIFLIVLVAIGMAGLNYFSSRQDKTTDKPGSQTMDAVLGLKDQIVSDTTMQDIADQVKKKGSLESLNSISEQVKGEASKAAEQVVDQASDTVMDYVYDKTLVQVINKLINQLPDRQKSQLLDNVCAPPTSF